MHKDLLSILPLLALMAAPLHGEEVQGAEAILQQLKDPAAQNQPKDPAAQLKARLDAFRTAAAALPPEKAAADWIRLLEDYLNLPRVHSVFPSSSQLSVESLFEVLPPVSSWDSLAAELQNRSASGKTFAAAAKNLLGALLASDPAGRQPALARLKEATPENTSLGGYASRMTDEVIPSLEGLLSPPGSPGADPVARLATALNERITPEFRSYRYLEIPKLPDTPEAREVLIRFLKADIEASFADKEAEEFVIRIAIERLGELPEPPWKLILATRNAPLFEAAAKLRPDAAKALIDSGEMDGSLLSYYLNQGREEDARAIIENPKRGDRATGYPIRGREHSDADQTADNEAAEKLLLKLQSQALQKNPNLPYWNSVRHLAHKYKETAAFQKSATAALTDPRVTSSQVREELEDIHLTHLLNDGKADEGLKSLQAMLEKARKPAESTTTEPGEEGVLPAVTSSASRYEHLLIRAIRIARLLDRPELLDASLDELSRLLPQMRFLNLTPEIWNSYIERNRAASLEKGLADRIALQAAPKENDFYGTNETESSLIQLAWLYDQLGRHEDVIRLLDEAPYWSTPDLAETDIRSRTNAELLLIAAKAMKATGRDDKALEVTRHLVRNNPGRDDGYLFLSQLNPPDQMDLLDEIARSNRFQERPLIWKAKLLLDQGKTEEAEATVKQAIAIDPSDGEQGKGDRMRAYDVLADILEKKGDAEQTTFFRNVVAAIRLSETADDWWDAGMTKKAIEIYEQSLQSFADAYCIQSRLALRYASEDNMEKATQHYQRAFELMPDSFGRIESHCFGCEGAFTGEVAQSIAEKVFTELAAKPDAKPQVFYLLGYLRQSQSRPQEAKEFFWKTVKMDPDYVNAWAKLQELSYSPGMNTAEQDEIAFNLFRLNSQPGVLSSASDLRKIWEALLTAENNLPPTPKHLYPLEAAKAELARKSDDRSRRYFIRSNDERPRAAFARQPLMQGMRTLLEASVSVE